MADYVTLREYDTVAEAKDAEQQLVLGGITAVNRTGKKVRVDADYEAQARAMLAGTTTPADTVASATSTVSNAAQGAASSVSNAAQGAASTASNAAQGVASTVQGAASTATDAVQGAASTVVDTAQQVASNAAETVQDAATAVTSQASKVTSVAADKVRDLADTVRQQGSSPNAPRVQQQAAQTTAGVLEKTSQYIQPGGFQTLLNDVRNAIRRHPVRSLAIGLGVGYLLRSQYFPSQASSAGRTQVSSTPPAPPSTPLLPPPPSVPTASVPDTNVSYTPSVSAVDTAPAPVLDSPTALDTSFDTADMDLGGTAIGDDLLDVGSVRDVDTDLDTSMTDIDMTTGAVDTDLYTGSVDTDLSTMTTDTTLGGYTTDLDTLDTLDDDLLGSGTLADDATTSDLLDMGSTTSGLGDADLVGGTTYNTGTSSAMDTSGGALEADAPTTTPLSTDDLDTSGATTTTDDPGTAGTSTLGEIAARWDARTRGEGPQE